MVRLALYLGLTVVGLIAAFISPVAGALACFEAYLLNPSVFLTDAVDVRIQLWTSVAFFIGVLIHRPRGLPAARRENVPIKLLWAFVALGAASAAWAEVSSSQALEAINELFKTVLMISIVIRVIEREEQMSLIVTGCIVGVWHAAVAHTFGVRWGFVPHMFGKDQGVLPDGQTPVMVLFVPLLVILAMLGNKWQRILSCMALPFVLDSIVVSYMRTGFVSLAVEVVLLILFLPKRITLRIAPVLIAGACLFVFRLTPEDYWQRVDTIKAPTEEASANSRFLIAGASIQILLDHPFGVGYRNYPDVSPRYLPADMLTNGRRSAHNSYFSIACETGVPGFILWISAFLGALYLLRRIRRASAGGQRSPTALYAMGFEIGLFGWMAGGLFQADHEVDPAYWFVAFAVILTRLYARERQSTLQAAEEPYEHTEAARVTT
jgi:O-antigen ligase